MKKTILTAVFLMAGTMLPSLASSQTNSRQNNIDRQVETLVSSQMQKKEVFRSVTATVDDGIVTLNGTVPLFIDKVNAEKGVRKVKGVDGVRNHIAVSGPAIADSEMQENLANKLRYDRIGYGIVFNSLAVSVDRGVATISGNVRDFPDRDSAIAIVSTTSGVRGIVDEISVAPVSIMDDNLRVRLARSIYGNPGLRKYAIDPQAPIRIVVENGNVELAGVVLNEMDRQLAFLCANSVPGVFRVTNHIVVSSELVE